MTIMAELGHGEQQDEAIHFITEGAQVLRDKKLECYLGKVASPCQLFCL